MYCTYVEKLYPESTVDACDISLEALDLAKENSEIIILKLIISIRSFKCILKKLIMT